MKALEFTSKESATARDLAEAATRKCDMVTTTSWWGVTEQNGKYYLCITTTDIPLLSAKEQAALVSFKPSQSS